MILIIKLQGDKMACNVGKKDKTFRFIVGIIVVLVGVAYQSWFGLIGAVFILTAALGWCPAYIPFNINTSKNDDSSCGSGGCGCSK